VVGPPLYRYAGDAAPGDTNGQGVGGSWYAITPQGKKATSGGTSASASASAAGYGYGN
jgi:hypothetical protein